jgi:hypothetical protein
MEEIVHPARRAGTGALASYTLEQLGAVVEEVKRFGRRLPAGERQVCVRLVTELIRQRYPGRRAEQAEWTDDSAVESPAVARYLNLPASRWRAATSWRALIEQLPADGVTVVEYGQPGHVGHAVALVDTTNGVYVIDPRTHSGVDVYPAPDPNDTSLAMPALWNARALTIGHDGRPIVHDQPHTLTGQAVTDPTDPRIGASTGHGHRRRGRSHPYARPAGPSRNSTSQVDTGPHEHNEYEDLFGISPPPTPGTTPTRSGLALPGTGQTPAQIAPVLGATPTPPHPLTAPIAGRGFVPEPTPQAETPAYWQAVRALGAHNVAWGQQRFHIGFTRYQLPFIFMTHDQREELFTLINEEPARFLDFAAVLAAIPPASIRHNDDRPDPAGLYQDLARLNDAYLDGAPARTKKYFLRKSRARLPQGVVAALDQRGMRWSTKDAVEAARRYRDKNRGVLLPPPDEEITSIDIGHGADFDLASWIRVVRRARLTSDERQAIQEAFGPEWADQILAENNQHGEQSAASFRKRSRRDNTATEQASTTGGGTTDPVRFVPGSDPAHGRHGVTVAAAEAYSTRMHHLLVPTGHKEPVEINGVVTKVPLAQRMDYYRRNRAKLPRGVVAALDRLGMRWSTKDAIEAARRYRDKNPGVLLPPPDEEITSIDVGHGADFDLASWIRVVRRARLTSAERQAIQKAFGPEWANQILAGAQSQVTLAAAAAYSTREHHLLVPTNHKEEVEINGVLTKVHLAQRLADLRRDREKLPPEEVAQWNRLGMRWSTKDAIEAVRRYRDKNRGVLLPPPDEEITSIDIGHDADFDLASWIRAVRRAQLTSDERQAIQEAFGFEWADQILAENNQHGEQSAASTRKRSRRNNTATEQADSTGTFPTGASATAQARTQPTPLFVTPIEVEVFATTTPPAPPLGVTDRDAGDTITHYTSLDAFTSRAANPTGMDLDRFDLGPLDLDGMDLDRPLLDDFDLDRFVLGLNLDGINLDFRALGDVSGATPQQYVTAEQNSLLLIDTPHDGDCFMHALLQTAGPSLRDPSEGGQVTSVTRLRNILADTLRADLASSTPRYVPHLRVSAWRFTAEQTATRQLRANEMLRDLLTHEELIANYTAGPDQPIDARLPIDWEMIIADLETLGSYANVAGDLAPLLAAHMFGLRINVILPQGNIYPLGPDSVHTIHLARTSRPEGPEHWLATQHVPNLLQHPGEQ